MSSSDERGQGTRSGQAGSEGDEVRSRTRKKKEAQALQVLGEKLVKLSSEQLCDIELPEELFEAIVFAGKIRSREAYRRQMQYIGTLMRKIDTVPIERAMHNLEMGDYNRNVAFRETERWRDALISGDPAVMEEVLASCADADRQKLSQLVRNARKDAERNRPPKSSRALFRYLREIRK